MTSVFIFGGTGYAGRHIASEAARRGNEVVVFSRSAPESPVQGVQYRTANLVEAVPSLEGAEVIVATLSPRGPNEGAVRGAYKALADAVQKAGLRLVVVGGFSSLRPAEGAPRFVEGDVPEQFTAEANEMNLVLGDLEAREDDLDWLFVSPAATFGAYAPGTHRGEYRKSGEIAIFDDSGESAISAADFADAIVDEIQTPTEHRTHLSFAY